MWPGITDFTEAVQNPGLCFRGTDFETGEVSRNRRGLPLVFSGAFACVYPVSVANRTFAVRCFTREVSDQDARYGALSNYLLSVLPPSFVHFEYVEQGISVRGDWYPIVKMDWVDGELLNGFVGSRLDQPDTLRRVAAQWRGGPVASLRGLRIAHNDLQHGNVMVQADGSIRLVDYDGMYLPEFRGERSPELGHKNYQHPQRSAEHYDENVDNFPSLVIYLSLLAVAADAGLWDFHDEDNLILTRKDYADPGSSEVFGRLKRSSDPTVAKLTERLEEYCGLPLEEVPDLETVLQDSPPSAPIASVPPPALPHSPAPPPRRLPDRADVASQYPQSFRPQRPAPAPATPPTAPGRSAVARAARPVTTARLAVPQPKSFRQSLSDSFSGTVSTVAASWLRWLFGGMGVMSIGWVIHTDVFLSVFNALLLITGIVAVIVFVGTKHPTALVVGVIALAVRFLNLLDWAVNLVWAWLILAGLVAVVAGGGARIATHKGAYGRVAVGLVILVACVWSFLVLTDFDLWPNDEPSLGTQFTPEITAATSSAIGVEGRESEPTQ